MKKALGQTVRDLKRGVNKKVLKVPSIEQKILDATSNEPWGPHGSILADIAQATRNYHEYQMIMSVIWKRINDTGKNWRHVYKALTVLEYLVAHGSERVIDEIREHAYQISALSDFQYIDSSGRDQGSNVRKKSQSLVVLVNDKESIQEARQKAAANRDKYSMGGMSRPGSYSSVGGYGERYDDDGYEGRYGSRDEDRNGYGREREWGSRDDDRYGKYGDSNSRDGDRYGKESEEYYGRDGYRDDDSHGRTRSVDDYNYRDRDRDRSYEDDGQYSSSRGNGAKTDDLSQDGSVAGRPFDRKYSEPNIAHPSYEEAVGEARSLTHSERNGETPASSAPKLSSPPPNTSDLETTFSSTQAPAPAPAPTPTPAPAPAPETNEFDGFDEFDPRGSFSAAPISSNGAEMDFLGSLSKSFSSNSLAIVSTTTATATLESDAFTDSDFGNGFPSESAASNLPFEDPFGDGPFRAISYTDGFQTQLVNVDSTSSFHSSTYHSEPPQPTTQNTETVNNFGFGDTDILADILPPSGPSAMEFPVHTVQPALQTDFQGQINERGSVTSFHGQPDQFSSHTSSPVQIGQPSSMTGFPAHDGQPAPQAGFPHQSDQHSSLAGFPPQTGTAQQLGFPAPGQASQPGANFYGSFNQQSGSAAPGVQPMVPQIPTGPSAQYNTSNFIQQSGSLMVPQMQQAGFNGSFNQQSGSTAPGVQPMVPQIPAGPSAHYNTSNFIQQSGSQMAPQMQQAGFSAGMTSAPAPPVSTNSLAIVPQPVKDKFETKSTVWADTLNRGLVNLNISGSKTNPLADIGVDFDAINRKEKRMEKPSQTPVVSTITMGKAMGSGSGIGRAGAGALRGALNPMMGSGIHIGMGGALGAGMGMGGAGMGMGGPPGAGMGMGGARFTGMGMSMSMGMGMGAGYGVNQPVGGVGMGMNMGVGAGMNTGMEQGVQMQQQPTGFPPGSTMPGGYNPMMGTGNFSQQPYNGGYR